MVSTLQLLGRHSKLYKMFGVLAVNLRHTLASVALVSAMLPISGAVVAAAY